MNTRRLLTAAALLATPIAIDASTPQDAGGSSSSSSSGSTTSLPNQALPTPFNGQHVGASFADLNGDGVTDLLFAAGRHWIDQPYALINLGPQYDTESGEFVGVKFSEALPIGVPGGYYQIDVVLPNKINEKKKQKKLQKQDLLVSNDGAALHHTTTVLLVGGTCHYEHPTPSFGSCKKGTNTPARVLTVHFPRDTVNHSYCSIHNPDETCSSSHYSYNQIWEHPDPKGDRNGGFATFSFGNEEQEEQQTMIALVGQGGIEVFQSVSSISNSKDDKVDGEKQQSSSSNFVATGYSSVFQDAPPTKTDPRSDYARYAGFAAGQSPKLGGVIAAGRRSDYDAPEMDANGDIVGINKLIHHEHHYPDDPNNNKNNNNAPPQSSFVFESSTLPADVSGEPYPGNPRYSIQTTNYAFADIDGDGVQDLLEATFLYGDQRVVGYPLPQRVHFLDENGGVRDTLVVLEYGQPDIDVDKEDNDTIMQDLTSDSGRSVTTGQIFSDSTLPDVVFASAEGVVTLFANLGVDKSSGKFLGLEQRHQLSVTSTDNGCQVRDVVVTKLAQDAHQQGKCWIGIVCAVTCGVDILGKNQIFYVEGDGSVCDDDDDNDDVDVSQETEVSNESLLQTAGKLRENIM